VSGDLTGKREYIGNKIIFQPKVFDGNIMVIYVTLFGQEKW
jgi:hypothetical protein